MWKDERRKKIIINCILLVLVIASALALLLIMNEVKERNNAYDALLAQKFNEQQQQYAEEKQEALENLQKAYEEDLDTVAKYMPGIVCWGDQLTAGSFGNVSFPDVLQEYINAHICDVYAFSSTVDNPEKFTRVDWEAYKVEIPVVNMGAGEETSDTTVGRSGAAPFTVHTEFKIPETTQKVPISFVTPRGKYSTLLSGVDVGVNNVFIGGIEGKLSLSDGQYYFERCEQGSEAVIPAGTEIITAASEKYRDYIHVIWLGTYGGYTSADNLVAQVKQILSRQTGNSDRFIVLGPCSKNENWEGYIQELDTLDTKMFQAFGNNYINLRKYLCADGMEDAGMKMTNVDLADVNIGAVPYSMRSVSGSAEFTSAAYKLIGKLIYDRMDKLGFFEEISDELNIAETTKNLLNANPHYFDNIVP